MLWPEKRSWEALVKNWSTVFRSAMGRTTAPTFSEVVLHGLAEALVRGLDPVSAAKQCGGNARENLDALVGVAEEMARHPLLRVARVAYARLQSREWVLNAQRQLANNRVVVATESELDREGFLREYYYLNLPVLCPSIAACWPATAKWTRSYLEEIAGGVEVEAMFGRQNVPVHLRAAGDRIRHRVRLGDFLSRVWSSRTDDFYLVGANDFFAHEGTAALAADIGTLPFARTECAGGGVKLWIGPAGTFTPFHYDSRNNVMVQLVGRKRVMLSPPFASELMAQVSPWYAGHDPLKDLTGDSLPLATIELGPGDALFLPVGWWHAVEGLTATITATCSDFGVPNNYDRPLTSLELPSVRRDAAQ